MPHVKGRRISETLLLAVFALSGFAALIYQICWQRLLFGAFGVDIESITIIISTFMLGLGCGGLIGGQLADRFNRHLLEIFIGIEIGICVFGALSPQIIPVVGEIFVNSNLVTISVANFLVLLFPTTLMGATLPILVAHMFRKSNSVGLSIGSLYLANTLGAALGAFLSGIVLFIFFTINQTIYMSAGINLVVASLTFLGLRKT